MRRVAVFLSNTDYITGRQLFMCVRVYEYKRWSRQDLYRGINEVVIRSCCSREGCEKEGRGNLGWYLYEGDWRGEDPSL
jgi:hypothetical protein